MSGDHELLLACLSEEMHEFSRPERLCYLMAFVLSSGPKTLATVAMTAPEHGHYRR